MRPPICRWLRNRKRLPSLLVPLSPVLTEPYTKFPQRTPNRGCVRLRSLNATRKTTRLTAGQSFHLFRLLHSVDTEAPALRMAPAPCDCPPALRQGFRRSSMLAAVAQQMARRRISALSILEGDPAVNSDRAIAVGALHAPPFTTREVAHDLHRLDCKLVEIVDHDVSPIAFDQRAAILETRTHRRMGAQAPVQLFQAHHVVFASDLDQCLGRVAPAGK